MSTLDSIIDSHSVLLKQCPVCLQWRSPLLFRGYPALIDLRSWCQVCRSEYYKTRNKRHSQETNNFKRSETWKLCLEYWQHSCAICSQTADSNFLIVPDHWIPFALGGTTTPDNIVPLCFARTGKSCSKVSCNDLKRAKRPEVWLSSIFDASTVKQKAFLISTYFGWIQSLKDDR